MTTITIDRATVEQALEALYEETAWFGPTPKGAAAITALRAALAEPVQEPVASLMTNIQSGDREVVWNDDGFDRALWHETFLYTAPQPCPTCESLARTVMLDQVSYDQKPAAYAIHEITDDDGIEEWVDIWTSPDRAREDADALMAAGCGERYEVVPLYTAPQPAPDDKLREVAQLALKAMTKASGWMSDADYKRLNQATDALRAALEAK